MVNFFGKNYKKLVIFVIISNFWTKMTNFSLEKMIFI